ALAHLNSLRPGDVVIYDRGYFSYAMLYAHQSQVKALPIQRELIQCLEERDPIHFLQESSARRKL
ncbi:MAG: hypothetical protein ABFS02_06230, partial [Pseudomonadota bacterium]